MLCKANQQGKHPIPTSQDQKRYFWNSEKAKMRGMRSDGVSSTMNFSAFSSLLDLIINKASVLLGKVAQMNKTHHVCVHI